MRQIGVPARLAAAAILASGLAGTVRGATEQIGFPTGYQKTFTRYDVIDRKIVRNMYVNPAGLDAAKPGEPIPAGTILIMEDHKAKLGADEQPLLDQNGRFIAEPEITAIFVQEKEAGWGADYPAEKRNGEWEYAVFNPDGSRKVEQKFDGCFSCHKGARAASDFNFTFTPYLRDHKKG